MSLAIERLTGRTLDETSPAPGDSAVPGFHFSDVEPARAAELLRELAAMIEAGDVSAPRLMLTLRATQRGIAHQSVTVWLSEKVG